MAGSDERRGDTTGDKAGNRAGDKAGDGTGDENGSGSSTGNGSGSSTGSRSGSGRGDTHNEFSGSGGPVFQGRDFIGDIIVHPPAPATPRPAGDPELAKSANDLAFAVTRQWEKEAALRRLNDPYPLPVRWRPAAPELMEPWSSLVRLATTGVGRTWRAPRSGWAPGPQRLSGSGGELVDVLEGVPTGRLVVLGGPGSGKSILLVRLVLDLLARRRPGDPAPVLAPLASWDPDRADLDDWLEQRLGVDYPGLAEPGRTGTSRGRELLDAGLIMLVLDGLDEIPDHARGRAIAGINQTLGRHPGLGLVLASRAAPFTATVRPESGTEVRVSGAAGVELLPLDLDTVSQYLQDSAGGPATAGAWREVFATLAAADGPHPLALALVTPLMAALARVVHNPPPGEQTAPRRPAELLDRARFPTPEAIQTHLLDAFVPAAYALRPAGPDAGREWTRRQATRFLTFLARDLENRGQGTTDLRWWDLPDSAPRPLIGAVVGLAAVPAAAVMPFGAWLGIGMVVGSVTAMAARRWSPPGRSLIRGLAGGLLGCLVGSAAGYVIRSAAGLDSPPGYLISGLALGLIPGFLGGLRAGVAGGMAASFVAGFVGKPTMEDPSPLANGFGFAIAAACVVTLGRRRLPSKELRWSPLGIVTALGGGLALAVAVALQKGLLAGAISGAIAAAGGSFGAGLEARPAEPTATADPQTALRRDRATFRTTALAGGLAIGLAAAFVVGAVKGPAAGVASGLADSLATGLAWGFLQASYGSFTLARWWLALRRKVPWDLMRFLADAHGRGVLRQAGATYQLRHVELQRHLAQDRTAAPSRQGAGAQGAREA